MTNNIDRQLPPAATAQRLRVHGQELAAAARRRQEERGRVARRVFPIAPPRVRRAPHAPRRSAAVQVKCYCEMLVKNIIKKKLARILTAEMNDYYICLIYSISH